MYTRRGFSKLLLAATTRTHTFATQLLLAHSGLRLGLESYSLSPLHKDGLQDRWIALMKQLQFSECNLYEPLIQPDELTAKLRIARAAKEQTAIDAAQAALREWRTNLPLSYFSDMRKKFAASGIRFSIFSTSSVTPTSTDAELERACAITQSLGAEYITISAGKSVVKRLIPLLDRYDLRLCIQGRPSATATDPDAIARLPDYEEAVAYSQRCSIDIDIGDATGAGFDVMPFITKNHARIYRIELKDRKRDGTSVAWGTGDTPVKGVLQYVLSNRLPVRCYIDCDYAPADESRIASILTCRAFIRRAIGL
jgi:sugar phosphate isomerase/epimerase